jgi:hypothetical protein
MPEVYLFDILDAVPSRHRNTVQSQLNGYFSRCSPKGRFFRCWWWKWDPTPSEFDILIYFLPFGKSVVRKLYPEAPSPIGGHKGLTYGTKPRVSEVYVKDADPTLLANLAFHEAMHMKLQQGNGMHTQGGLASGDVSPGVQLSKDNIKSMQAALAKPVEQWTGGLQILYDSLAAVAAGDPLAPISE